MAIENFRRLARARDLNVVTPRFPGCFNDAAKALLQHLGGDRPDHEVLGAKLDGVVHIGALA